MTKLTKDTYKKGHQTVVFNSNSTLYQVQTWTGTRWYGFVSVIQSSVSAEKQRQLAELATNKDINSG